MQYFVGNVAFQSRELQSPPSSVKWYHSEDRGHTDMTSLRIWASPPTVSGALDICICSGASPEVVVATPLPTLQL